MGGQRRTVWLYSQPTRTSGRATRVRFRSPLTPDASELVGRWDKDVFDAGYRVCVAGAAIDDGVTKMTPLATTTNDGAVLPAFSTGLPLIHGCWCIDAFFQTPSIRFVILCDG